VALLPPGEHKDLVLCYLLIAEEFRTDSCSKFRQRFKLIIQTTNIKSKMKAGKKKHEAKKPKHENGGQGYG